MVNRLYTKIESNSYSQVKTVNRFSHREIPRLPDETIIAPSRVSRRRRLNIFSTIWANNLFSWINSKEMSHPKHTRYTWTDGVRIWSRISQIKAFISYVCRRQLWWREGRRKEKKRNYVSIYNTCHLSILRLIIFCFDKWSFFITYWFFLIHLEVIFSSEINNDTWWYNWHLHFSKSGKHLLTNKTKHWKCKSLESV